MLETKVKQIVSKDELYQLKTADRTIQAKAVLVAAGAHSLLFAKSLGYGLNYALLSVAGSFYFAPGLLNGKVYTVQRQKLPFAAVHGDREVHDRTIARFGPTAKVLPMLERGNYGSIVEYFQTAGLSVKAIASFLNILSDATIFKYIAEAKIVGDRIIFNITSSPGASTCLQNALEDTERAIAFLGKDYKFDRQQFLQDLPAEETKVRSAIEK